MLDRFLYGKLNELLFQIDAFSKDSSRVRKSFYFVHKRLNIWKTKDYLVRKETFLANFQPE